MSEVQGTVEFSVELHKFHNVDLFQRGFYQVRVGLKVSPRVPHRLIATATVNTGSAGVSGFSTAAVHDDCVFSRIFQILYRNEEISVNDTMNFKVHLLLDGERVEEALSEVDFQLKLDLHFTDNEQQLSEIAAVPVISSRTLGLHFHPRRGLHHHVPVMFDYFHLSVISVSIHASLVALHQPLISFARSGKGSWLGKGSPENGADPSTMSIENLMFGAGYCKPVLTEGSFYVPSENCLQRAQTWHRRLCRLLLAAHRGLRTYYTQLMKEIPQLIQEEIEELPIEETLAQLSFELQLQNGHEKVAERISRDLAQLGSHLAALWAQFLEAAVPHTDVLSHLAQEHHTLRVRRFSEAYFFTEHPKESSLTFQEDLITRHGQIAVETRSSDYLTRMPPLPVECLDIDGDWNSLPIIFEDRYVELLCPDQKSDDAPMCASRLPSPVPAGGLPPSDSPAAAAAYTTGPAQTLSPCHTPAITQGLSHLSFTGQQRESSDSCVEAGHPGRGAAKGEDDSGTGLKYIEVRPSDADPYRGDSVLIVMSSDSVDKELMRSSSKDLSHSCNLAEDVCEGGVPLKVHEDSSIAVSHDASRLRILDLIEPALTNTPTQCKSYGNEDQQLISLSTSESLVSEQRLAPRQARSGNAHSAYGDPKTMKRSSSVISDSGIESEPSSAAWPDLRARPRDSSGERDVPQLPARRHASGSAGHRSSLEGFQTESNASLPSGIQASLTSISSLPYEEEEQEVELSKLTKSVSAPQISSPEDTEEDQEPASQEPNGESQGTNGYDTSQNPDKESQRTGGYGLSQDPDGEIQGTGGCGLSQDPDGEIQGTGGYGLSQDPDGEIRGTGGYGLSQDPDGEIQGTGGYGLSQDPDGESQGMGGYGLSQDPDGESQGTGGYELLDTYATVSGSDISPFNPPVVRNFSPEEILGGGLFFDWATTTVHQQTMPYIGVYDSKDSEEPAKPDQTQSDILGMESVLSGVPEVLLFKRFVEEHSIDDSAFGQLVKSPEHCQNSSMLKLEVPLGSISEKYLVSDDDQSYHQINLNERDGDEQSPPTTPGCPVQPLFSAHEQSVCRVGATASEEEHPPFQGQGKPPRIPSLGLAFMNKKVVEVVNMSVSCAPTCLPFSSALRDSPSVNGVASRPAASPITHQPLGSFGLVSSTSFCADEETNERMLNFYQAKEELMTALNFQATLYSDLPQLASDLPYFPPEEDEEEFEDGIHLVVCVHGLDGNSADLRLVKTFIELGLPGSRLDFLMSERNQTDTFADFDTMTDRLLDEIIQHIQLYNLTIGRISFIGHSLGNVIIRSVLTRPRFRCYLCKLYTFLSLSGPHLGMLYNNSTLVSTGLWLMQKLKKSGSLLQLTFRDHTDPRKTFLYLLSQKPGLQYFKNVVLVASPQDRYVPFHSARIEMCRTALRDRITGPVYTEMINNLLRPLVEAEDCRLIRQNVFHALPNTANTLIGRAAHIAVLDSELFLEKFFLVAGLSYFK